MEKEGNDRISYIIGDDILAQAKYEDSTTTHTVDYLLYDGHGSTRQLTDSAGVLVPNESYSYDGYGVMLGGNPAHGSSPATSLLYAGEHFDTDAQQYYLRARWYNPSNGRFNRVDPYAGSPQNPQSLHKYLYVHNNPVNAIDPSGLFIGILDIGLTVLLALAILLIAFPIIYHFDKSLAYYGTRGTCGKDVTRSLKKLGDNIQNIYNDWVSKGIEKQKFDAGVGFTTWDVQEFIAKKPPKDMLGTDRCEKTVTVNDECYSIYEVNYYLWGRMNKLCGNSWRKTWGYAFAYAMWRAPTKAWGRWEQHEGSVYSKVNWAEIGYENNLDLAIPWRSEFNTCGPCRIYGNWGSLNAGWGGGFIYTK